MAEAQRRHKQDGGRLQRTSAARFWDERHRKGAGGTGSGQRVFLIFCSDTRRRVEPEGSAGPAGETGGGENNGMAAVLRRR